VRRKERAPTRCRRPTSKLEVMLKFAQRRAIRDGIELRWRRIKVRGRSKKPVYHVMLDLNGKRLVDFWPTTGMLMAEGVKTKVSGLDEAIDVAHKSAGITPNLDMSVFVGAETNTITNTASDSSIDHFRR
jgi:hypothetical protein